MLIKLATFQGVSKGGEPLTRVFHPGDQITKVAGTMLPDVQKWLSEYKPVEGKIPILVNALGASEYWGQNVNGDVFPESSLVHNHLTFNGHYPMDDFTGKTVPPYGHKTFLDAHPFVHHKNKDPSRAFGEVVVAVWNAKMRRVELVVILDRELASQHGAQHVVDKIDAGEYCDVSMGCKVPYDVCTCCGHKSRTTKDYCCCITQLGMGRILEDGRRVGVVNYHPRFFDISFVFIGADKTAKMMCKLASGVVVPQSVMDAELVYGISSNDDGVVKSSSMEKVAKAQGGEKRTYEVEGHPDVIKRIDVLLETMNRLGGWGSSRGLKLSIDGDGPEFLYVGGTKYKPNKEQLQRETEREDVNIGALTEPSQTSKNKMANVNLHTGAGVGGAYLAGDDVNRASDQEEFLSQRPDKKPDQVSFSNLDIPGDGKLLMSKEDPQTDRRLGDDVHGPLKTNDRMGRGTDDNEEYAPDHEPKTAGPDVVDLRHPEKYEPSSRLSEDYMVNPRERVSEQAKLGMTETDNIDVHSNPDENPKTVIKETERKIPVQSSMPDNVRKRPAEDANLAKLGASQRSKVMRFYTAKANLPKVWKDAKKIKIGPPPQPNRPDFPFVGTIKFRGLTINVENAPGTYRTGRGWQTKMHIPYGEFQKSEGTDGDPLDVYVGPYFDAPNVYIIHQNFVRGPNKGEHDEDKVMVGFKSIEQATNAYLAHYDKADYLRSVTTMTFDMFKKGLMKKQFHKEKVAFIDTQPGNVDLQLEDLFTSAQNQDARRRQRVWKNKGEDGKDHIRAEVTGSGMGSSEKAKQASAPRVPTAIDLLKMASDDKIASHLKWADIIKRVGPDKAVGRVAPALSESEPSLPPELLNEMGDCGLEGALATPTSMGMVLKPEEFQRIALAAMGKTDLADSLDNDSAVFKPVDGECAPCSPLSLDHSLEGLLDKLLPFLRDKSYFGPPLKRRIVRITIAAPAPRTPRKEVNSPLLSKVSAAYTWYRREQMKLAGDAAWAVPNNPKLHVALHGASLEDSFGKTASSGTVDPRTLAVVLGAIPITMMYSAHLQGKQRRGEEMGALRSFVAEHPWLTTMGVGAGLRELMKHPRSKELFDDLLVAGHKVWTGKGPPEVILPA